MIILKIRSQPFKPFPGCVTEKFYLWNTLITLKMSKFTPLGRFVRGCGPLAASSSCILITLSLVTLVMTLKTLLSECLGRCWHLGVLGPTESLRMVRAEHPHYLVSISIGAASPGPRSHWSGARNTRLWLAGAEPPGREQTPTLSREGGGCLVRLR